MPDPDTFGEFVTHGLEFLGVPMDGTDLHIIRRYEEVYGAARRSLLEVDLASVEPEIGLDPGTPPTPPFAPPAPAPGNGSPRTPTG